MTLLETNTINDPIKVLASFSSSKIRVHSFCWNQRVYQVESMTMFYVSGSNQTKTYHFSITSKGNSYELTFSPITLSWRLKTVVAI